MNDGERGVEEGETTKDEKAVFDASDIEYVSYAGEHHLPLIMSLVDQELSEPYSIFTYRYFVYLWPQLSFLAFHRGKCVGTVVCKMGEHRNTTFRGYIAMLVVIKPYRGKGIATELVTRSIRAMMDSGCEEVCTLDLLTVFSSFPHNVRIISIGLHLFLHFMNEPPRSGLCNS
ncbi:N-alpha-acetyltransferase MAK3 [Linum perenne]